MRSAIDDSGSRPAFRTPPAGAGAAAAGIVAAVALLPAAPALAHGAPTRPISRTAACASRGEATGAAACRAARKATGGALGSFDNLRIANVNGRDKQVVPDGKLCSGGLDAYAGLDLPRTDWPSTSVTAGDTLSVRYAGTIPHKGSFRIYLTKPGYAPEAPLTWADLTGKPIAEVTDPPLRDGAYRMNVKLPGNRSGRHVLYTVWETSSTPDTYYSCSDLVIEAAPKAAASTRTAPATTKAAPSSPAPEPPAQQSPIATPAGAEPRITTTEPPRLDPVASTANDRARLGHWIIGGALTVILATLVGALLTRRRTARRP